MSKFTRVIQPEEKEIIQIVKQINEQVTQNNNENLVVDLSHFKSLSVADLKLFSEIATAKTNRNKSLVLVVTNINFNTLPKSIVAVPTLQEAHDLIEIEEIERDLGF